MIKIKTVAGPNPYVAGTGAQVTFVGECEKITSLIANCDNTDELAVADRAYSVRYSFTGITAKATVWALNTVAGGQAWTELVAGNFSGRTFTFIADCE